MKYLLIDGNNLAIRSAFANEYMTNKDGILSGAHYGFFNSLLYLKDRFPDYQMLIAWDSKSKRREEESSVAVEEGIVKEKYKANRKKTEIRPPLAAWFETAHHLKNAIGKTGIPQIVIKGYEADDVIASYCDQFRGIEFVIVTSDKDFYQLLNDNVTIWDGMKASHITEDTFKEMFDLVPRQHVDVGALMGDKGDNIFGVPGWGKKTSVDAIKEHGSWTKFYNNLKEKYKDVLDTYSGETISDSEFDILSKKKTAKDKYIYPEIYRNQENLGLLMAFDSKKIKMPKRDLMALMFYTRMKLAFSLKRMDLDIESLPNIESSEKDKEKLLEYFEYYDIVSLVDKVDVLF